MFLEGLESVITVFTKILFDHSPKVLNEIEFTVEFRKKYTEMTSCFNHLLNQRSLFLEIGLLLNNSLAATVKRVRFAFFTFSLKALDW
jgi:uncharacterized protein YllA (UPF0747 family)